MVGAVAYTLLGALAIGCAPNPTPVVAEPNTPAARVKDTWSLRGGPDDDYPATLSAGTLSVEYSRAARTLSVMVADAYLTKYEEPREPVSIPLPLRAESTKLPRYQQFLDLSTGTISYVERQTARTVATIRSDPARGMIALFDEQGGFPTSFSQTLPRGQKLIGAGDGKNLVLSVNASEGAIPFGLSSALGSFWDVDIEIDGPLEDQAAIRTWLWRLRTAIHPSNQVAPSPYGLTEGRYDGHVFWDADMWMFPALMLLDPERAAVIPRYRIRCLGVDKVTPYGWQTGFSGHDVTPPQSLRHRSAPGSVAFALHLANLLGLASDADADRVRAAVAEFYEENRDGAELKNVRSIDEYAERVNNDLYTNLVANWAISGWRGGPLRLPQDDETLLSYDGDPQTSYQQAAAVLSVFPLQYPPAEAQAQRILERFGSKVNRAGPAMSESIHATILARLGETQSAYDSWRRSWTEFCAPPFLGMREYRADTDEPDRLGEFHTGMAGSLNTVLYGFAGFRIDSRRVPGASWGVPLKRGYWLSMKPNLPPAWKSITIRGFSVLGKRYTTRISADRVDVQESR